MARREKVFFEQEGAKMHSDRFVWDEEKHRANIIKHKVSFNEAASVFDDVKALYIPDEKHSGHEERFLILGMSEKINLLMVCHCYCNGDSFIRIISARKATTSQRQRADC